MTPFKLVDTHGLPLVFVMDYLNKHKMAAQLDEFVYDALRAGWTPERAFAICQEALIMMAGPRRGPELARALEEGCKRRIAKGALDA